VCVCVCVCVLRHADSGGDATGDVKESRVHIVPQPWPVRSLRDDSVFTACQFHSLSTFSLSFSLPAVSAAFMKINSESEMCYCLIFALMSLKRFFLLLLFLLANYA